MSEINQSIQQPQLNESSNTLSEIESHQQNSTDNPIISIQSSEEFQNIDASRSQNISAFFNTLTDSHNQEGSNQRKTQNQSSQQKVQQSSTQQVVPEVQEQSKPQILQPQPTVQQKQQSQPTVDYEAMVSLKIFQKKINESLQLKNEGNQFFKANKFQEAIQKYSQGLAILEPQQFYGATQAQCQKMAEVSASLLFNIGMCFFNTSRWKQAQIYFNETIMINPNHIKAIYRRALCRFYLQNYEEAMADIKQAFNKDKSNVQVYEAYEKILEKYNEQVKKEKESMKEISTKIFRKDSQNSSAVSPQKEQKKNQEEEQEQEEKVKQQGEQESSGLWGLAPLALVAGAALFFGYKKFFGK